MVALLVHSASPYIKAQRGNQPHHPHGLVVLLHSGCGLLGMYVLHGGRCTGVDVNHTTQAGKDNAAVAAQHKEHKVAAMQHVVIMESAQPGTINIKTGVRHMCHALL